jgi:hypothetical protein
MYDINFFEEYRQNIAARRSRRILQGIIASVILGLTLGVLTGNILRIKKMEAVKEELLQDIDKFGVAAVKKQHTSEKTELLLLEAYEAWLTGIDGRLQRRYSRSSLTLEHVNASSFGLADIVRISSSGRIFSLIGYSRTPEAVAVYKSRLSKTGLFYDITIHDLKFENNLYNFTISGQSQ